MSYLILIRHGESRFNTVNKFTGWIDVPLSEKGVAEAMLIAKRVKSLQLDVAFTSHLERAHETLLVILADQHCTGVFEHDHRHAGFGYPFKFLNNHEIPIYTNWRLNERNYGKIQGMNKNTAVKKYGYKKVLAWRRGFAERPPEGESLKDVSERAVPYFQKNIMPKVREGKNVMVVAHGNTLRAIIKHLEKIPDDMISNLELNPGQPFIYQWKNKKMVKKFENYEFNRPIAWK